MFKEVWSFAITHLPAWAVFILILFMAFAFIVKTISLRKEFRDPISFWLKKRVYKIRTVEIINHPIFKQKILLEHKINSVFFEDKIKTDILKIFHKTKINTDVDILQKFVSSAEYKNPDFSILSVCCQITADAERIFNENIRTKLIEYCKTQDVPNDKVEGCASEILDFVMNSKGGFLEQRMKRVEMIFESAELIESSPIYDNNYEKTFQFLDVLKIVLSNAVMKIERMFQSFNGTFASIVEKYKSV